MNFTPTDEQDNIDAAVETGGSVKIIAGAGTGKTSTLRMVGRSLAPKRGLFICYNKAIQTEAAASFPTNVTCKTAHSLAFGQFGRLLIDRINGQRISASSAAAMLGIQPLTVEIDDETVTIQPKNLAIIVKEAIGRFCNSADERPEAYHVPTQPGVDRGVLSSHVLPYVRKAWDDINSSDGRLRAPYVSHDCYLKQWSLSRPTLRYDFILFDEAQDANPCISVVVEAQKAQQIFVGDSAQAIYGWRGAVDAMETFKADHTLTLTKSFRFGPAVAEIANDWLSVIGADIRLTGFEQIDSKLETIEDPDVILCRTNAGVIESAMAMQATGKRVAVVGGTAQIEMFVKAASDLIAGYPTEHNELCIFTSWGQVQQAVKDGEADDLAIMVRLVDAYGTDAILDVCRTSTKPESADVIVSTAHKAKGLEWDRVRIHNDFKPSKDGTISKAEAMLAYVAVTRAKLALDAAALDFISTILGVS